MNLLAECSLTGMICQRGVRMHLVLFIALVVFCISLVTWLMLSLLLLMRNSRRMKQLRQLQARTVVKRSTTLTPRVSGVFNPKKLK